MCIRDSLLIVTIILTISIRRGIAEPTPPDRENYVTAQLNDGRVLFAAGADDNGNAIKRAEVFDRCV